MCYNLQKSHYRTDWHRYNLKLKLRGMDSIGQEKFEELAGKEIFLTILLALFLCSCFSHYAVTDSITTDTQSFLNVV